MAKFKVTTERIIAYYETGDRQPLAENFPSVFLGPERRNESPELRLIRRIAENALNAAQRKEKEKRAAERALRKSTSQAAPVEIAAEPSPISAGVERAFEKERITNISVGVPKHFVGCEMLDAIEAALKKNEGRRAIVALYGLPGMGKTTFAVAFATRHNANYRVVWQIRAQTEFGVRAGLAELGSRLGWVGAQDQEELAVAAVKNGMLHKGEGILLIYDNAIDVTTLEPYLPTGGAAQIIVTSNNHAWHKIAEPIEIRTWRKEVGADFLIARSDRGGSRAAAEALSEALGGLALAHEMAAAFCEDRETSLARCKERFDASPIKFLADENYTPTEYGLTVARTFEIAIEAATAVHPAAELLLVYAALLVQGPVPLFFFSKAREEFGKPLASLLDGVGLEDAVAALRTFALVNRETIADKNGAPTRFEAIRLHNLVREIAVARCEGEAKRQMNSTLVAAMAAAFPADGYDNPALWPLCDLLMAHLPRIIWAEPRPLKEFAKIESSVARYVFARAEYRGAKRWFELALSSTEAAYGAEHPEFAIALSDLARALEAVDKSSEAEPMYRRAVEIFARSMRGTEYNHQYFKKVSGNYIEVLRRLGHGEAEIETAIAQANFSSQTIGSVSDFS
jgi:hypothetical protein